MNNLTKGTFLNKVAKSFGHATKEFFCHAVLNGKGNKHYMIIALRGVGTIMVDVEDDLLLASTIDNANKVAMIWNSNKSNAYIG